MGIYTNGLRCVFGYDSGHREYFGQVDVQDLVEYYLGDCRIAPKYREDCLATPIDNVYCVS